MSSILSREQSEGYERWALPEIGAGAGGTGGVASTAPLRTLRQLENLERQARDEGFARGLAEGREAARRELEIQAQRLEDIFETLSRPLADLDETVGQQLALLATAIARQLIRRELQIAPEAVIGTVKAALLALPVSSRHIRVHLHPDDALLVRAHLTVRESNHHWEIIEDPLLSRGGCHIISEASQLDARVETRLGAVISAALGGERQADQTPTEEDQ